MNESMPNKDKFTESDYEEADKFAVEMHKKTGRRFVAFPLTEKEEETFKQRAKVAGMSFSDYTRKWLDDHLQALE